MKYRLARIMLGYFYLDNVGGWTRFRSCSRLMQRKVARDEIKRLSANGFRVELLLVKTDKLPDV